MFPLFAWLVSVLAALVFVLPSPLLPESLQADLSTPIKIGSQLVGLAGAVFACWRIWPKTASGDLNGHEAESEG